MKRCRQAVCSFLFLVGVSAWPISHSQESHPSPGSKYYPLAKGNTWKYRVQDFSNGKSSTVEWRVTSADKSKEGTIYQVWPFPSNSDDEAMRLHLSSTGVEEASSGVLILKYPAVSGTRWESAKRPRRTFHVLSVGHACHAGDTTSEDCYVIEDQDDALRFRTVTTYAKGIGPIRFEYYWKNSTSTKPMQTVELLSFHLSLQLDAP
jgi:hypothetical protein